MKLTKQPFADIKSGRQEIEVRMFDEKRQKIGVGDTITFKKLPELKEEITKEIIGYAVFENFTEMFNHIDKVKAGWDPKDTNEQITKEMEKYYPKEEQERYNVIGIFLK